MQQTPTGHEIPVPKRGDVFEFFRRAARPRPEPDEDAAGESSERGVPGPEQQP